MNKRAEESCVCSVRCNFDQSGPAYAVFNRIVLKGHRVMCREESQTQNFYILY